MSDFEASESTTGKQHLKEKRHQVLRNGNGRSIDEIVSVVERSKCLGVFFFYKTDFVKDVKHRIKRARQT